MRKEEGGREGSACTKPSIYVQISYYIIALECKDNYHDNLVIKKIMYHPPFTASPYN